MSDALSSLRQTSRAPIRRSVARVPAPALRPLPSKRMSPTPDLTLDDLLSDPLVQLVMERDGVGPEEARAAFHAVTPFRSMASACC
ncbi:hypothetical protein [Novispirillum itersonii]|uniref:Uncharacterized protein n=1 Tax=Novispirillum itersonii TaxID=189 RepID=A0A7W9ZFR7_NOVIT|nr:hypothetical protein [Novispirillum itersonii]MBB6209214.1 hypothetical protein [Novispirillum itersonii]